MSNKKKYARHVPCDSCGRALPEAIGYKLCPICWQVEKTCSTEGAEHLKALADPKQSSALLLWRVADVLRRSNVEDAEILVRGLEQRIR